MTVDNSLADRRRERLTQAAKEFGIWIMPPFQYLPDNDAEDSQLPIGHGGGTSGGVTDDWKENVDRQLGQLHADVRALLRWGVASVVAVAALIGGLYLRTDGKFDAIGQRLSAIEVEQARQSAKLDVLLTRTAPSQDRGTIGVQPAPQGMSADGK